MFFGDFLVQKKMISEQDLVEALVRQLSTTPPLLKILKDSGDFRDSDLIGLVKEQVNSGLEIKSLLLKMNVVSEENLQEYLNQQHNARLPVGQILIEMGRINVEECQVALEEFMILDKGIQLVDGEVDLDAISEDELISAIEEEKASAVVVGESEKEKNEFKEYLKSSERASVQDLLPDFEFEQLEEMVMGEYLEVFDELKRDSLDQEILSWKKLVAAEKSDDLKESFRLFYRELHTLKGTVRFLKGVVSEFTIHTAEDLLADLIVCASSVDQSLIDQLEDFYLQLTDLVWQLRMAMEREKTEQSLIGEETMRENLADFVFRAQGFKKVVEALLESRTAEDVASQF